VIPCRPGLCRRRHMAAAQPAEPQPTHTYIRGAAMSALPCGRSAPRPVDNPALWTTPPRGSAGGLSSAAASSRGDAGPTHSAVLRIAGCAKPLSQQPCRQKCMRVSAADFRQQQQRLPTAPAPIRTNDAVYSHLGRLEVCNTLWKPTAAAAPVASGTAAQRTRGCQRRQQGWGMQLTWPYCNG